MLYDDIKCYKSSATPGKAPSLLLRTPDRRDASLLGKPDAPVRLVTLNSKSIEILKKNLKATQRLTKKNLTYLTNNKKIRIKSNLI